MIMMNQNKPLIHIKEENLYVDRDEFSDILQEAEKSSDRLSALKLLCLMRYLADDCFMASWLADLDDEVLELIQQKGSEPIELGLVNISSETICLLRQLIHNSNGIWTGKQKFVSLDNYRK